MISGKVEFAEVMFLVALILFLVVAVIAAMARTFEMMLLAFGLAAAALAFFVL
jgi:hypothetical protein